MVKTENKWNKFAGGILKEEPLIDLYIPKDKLNPDDTAWVCLNGESCYLAKGKSIKVPQSIAHIWQTSYSDTMVAEEKMQKFAEIK